METWLQTALSWYYNVTYWKLFWLSIGFLGQIIFGCRFLVQWIISEHKGRSMIPRVFWYLSLGGTLMLFSYATYRLDPVFMLGQGMGGFIYVRNLVLLSREDRGEQGSGSLFSER